MNSINAGTSESSKTALSDKFGSKENWIQQTIGIVRQNGSSCSGSWSDVSTITNANAAINKPLNYTINWNFMSSYGKKKGGIYQNPGHKGYPKNTIFVFDPEFESFCDEHAKQLTSYKNDSHLFGHFSDNEMPFRMSALDDYLDLPKDNYGYKAAVVWLREQNITQGDINKKSQELFMAFFADTYFSLVSKAIKKYDPNQMYLGSRF